jgi:predicted RNA-binding Zn ribbon-like protein
MESRAIETLDLCGGHAAVDFVNTLGGLREGPWDDEWLLDYASLARWSLHAGLLGEEAVAGHLERARAEPRAAARVHAEAVELREALYRILVARAEDSPAASADREALAAVYRQALANARLVPQGDRLDWAFDAGDLRQPLWSVAHAATDLLRSGRLDRLSRCGRCRWLYLDASKNRSRRWCSMAHCGSEAKVRQAQARRRARA